MTTLTNTLENTQSLYLNPYVVQVENQNLISIYSIHSPTVIFQYRLIDRSKEFTCYNIVIGFYSFVEMVNGSLDLNGVTLYKHNTLFFLTSSTFKNQSSHKLVLQCIEMPTYENLS